jgi:hypothetical protein
MNTTQAIKTTLFAAALAVGASTAFAQSSATPPVGSPNPTEKAGSHSQGNQNPGTPLPGQSGTSGAAAGSSTGMTHGSSTTHSGGSMNSGSTMGGTNRTGGDASPSSETRGVPDSESKSTPIPSAQPKR